MTIRKARKSESGKVIKLARKLWPDVKASDMRPGYTFYIAEVNGSFIGFILLNVRKDYVEGSTSFPVGYIEGIYVEKSWRKKNVGRELVKAAEEWCVQKGLKELGSDVDLRNHKSQKFHSSVGFKKGDIMVPYIKTI
jgi:aminoglycoside 6'-N-acetyltransferase I